MGQEATIDCRTPWGDGKAKAHLDGTTLTLTGPVRGRLAISDIKKLAVEGDELVVSAAAGTFRLSLGAKAAARWRAKIASPPSLADKLGLKGEARARLVGKLPAEIIEAASGRTARKADIVLAAIEDKAEIANVATTIGEGQALWLVFRKGPTGPGETALIMSARTAGLKDTKVARVSESHTALRFIKPPR